MSESTHRSGLHQHALGQKLQSVFSLSSPRRLNKLAWVLGALAMGWEAQELFRRQQLWLGLLLYAVAIPIFAVKLAIQQREVPARSGTGTGFLYLKIAPGIRGWLGIAGMAGALILSGVSWHLFELKAHNSAAWATYLGSLLLFGLGVWLAESPVSSFRSSFRLPRPDILLLAIMALALFFRLFQFSSVPSGTWYDEATMGLEARRIVQDPAFRPVFSGAMNQMAHHLYLFALSMRLLGDSIAALRAVSVLLGLGAVVSAYLFGREYGGRNWGLLLAFLVACMRWHVNFSRIAMNGVDVPFFELLTLYLALRVVRSRRGQLRAIAWLGLCVGMGLCFYTPFRFFVVTGVLFGLGGLVSVYRSRGDADLSRGDAGPSPQGAERLTAQQKGEDGAKRSSFGWLLKSLALLMIAAWLAAMPTAQYAWQHSQSFWGRARHVSIFQNRDDPNVLRAMARNTEKHLLMFNYRGDNNGRHNLPGAPTLDRLSAILFAMGIGLAVARRDQVNVLFLCLLLAGLLGGILTLDFEAPQSLRSIAALPAVVYFIALSVDALWLELRGAGRSQLLPYGLAPIIAGLGAIALGNGLTYFGPQAHHPAVWAEFSTAETLVGKRMAELGHRPIYYTSPFFSDHVSVRFHAPPEAQLSVRKVMPLPDPLPAREAPDRPVIYFIHPDEEWVFLRALQIYPTADFEILPYGSEYPPAVYVVYLEPEQVASVQGLETRYGAGSGTEIVPGIATRSQMIDMVWPDAAPLALPFVAEWSGVLYAPWYGQYELGIQAPEHVELTLDGESWDGAGNLSLMPILAQGNHELRLRAVGGHGPVRLWWQPPAKEKESVPTWALYTWPISRQGLLGRYYPNSSWQGSPALERIDPTINMYFHLTPLPRPYSVAWTGVLNVPQDGSYELGLRSVDQAELYLGDQLLIEATVSDQYTQKQLELKAGSYDVRIMYQDLTGRSRIHLYWTRPGAEREIIPPTYLQPDRTTSPQTLSSAAPLPGVLASGLRAAAQP